MSFLENCRRLVALDSTPGHGNRLAAEFLGGLCEQAGLTVEYQRESLAGVDQCNVLARPQVFLPERELLLQTHLDTRPAGHFSQWTKTQANPFNASIYGDELFGLGAADAKLDFLCKLEAVRPLVGKALRVPFVLVGTFGAQTGMAGAIKLIRRKKLSATHAIVSEPTNMRLANAGTGLAIVDIIIPFSEEEKAYRRDHDLMESTTSQSRMFGSGSSENAIMKMLEYLAHLPDGIAVMDLDGGTDHSTVPAHALLEIDTVAGFKDPVLPKISKIHATVLSMEKELRLFQEEGFTPPYATMNLGMIRTSESEVRISGSCRLPPSVTDSVYEAWIKKLADAVQSAGATFCVKDYRKGFTTNPMSGFVGLAQEILLELGHNSSLHKLSMASEANVFSRLGIECVVWGPGQSVGHSHGPNESIKISDLKAATEFYRKMVERFCL